MTLRALKDNRLLILGGLVVLQAVALWWVASATLPTVQEWHGDLQYYNDIGLKLRQGQLPYRDFDLEYPPGSLLAFIVPQLLAPGAPPSNDTFIWLFFITSLAYSSVIVLALGAILARWQPPRRLVPALVGYAVLVGVAAPLLPWRYDLMPALLSVLALAAVFAGRPLAAGICLGLGVAAKLYPAVLIPILAVYYLTGGHHRAWVRLLLGSVGATLLCLAPFALTAPQALLSFVRYHQERGIHLESVPGGIVLMARLLDRTTAEVVFDHRAFHLASPLAAAILGWLTVTAAAALVGVWVAAYLRFRQEQVRLGRVRDDTLVVYIVIALLTFMAINKVFSAQFIAWLVPFLPLLRPRYLLVGLGAVAATIYLFPFSYQHLQDLLPASVLWLNARNLLLVALLGWLLVAYRPALVRRQPHTVDYQPTRAGWTR